MLQSQYRLRKNQHFRLVYRRGSSCSSSLLSMVRLKSGPPTELRVGFSVSKKVGNSVVRNHTKRLMREAIRTILPDIKRGYRLIFIARAAIREASFARIREDMYGLLRQSKLFKENL